MHHRTSLSSVSEAAINRTPARFKQREIWILTTSCHTSELNIALKVELGEKNGRRK